MRRRRMVGATGLVALVAGLVGGCDAAPALWDVEMVSVNAAGTDGGDAATFSGTVSDDGTRVAFGTSASNLGPVDPGGIGDVYVRDLDAGTTVLVSANASGTGGGNSGSWGPRISPDGTKVAFASDATDLGSADDNGVADLYVSDLATGVVERLAFDDGPCGEGGGHLYWPVFSPDSTKIAFSYETFDPGTVETYVHDLVSGTTSLVMPHPGQPPCSPAWSYPVAFDPTSSRLAVISELAGHGPVDTNDSEDLYLVDLATGGADLVSSNAAGTDSGNGRTLDGSFSPDGSKMVFMSEATDLGPVDASPTPDLYLRDLTTGATTLVSANAAGSGGGNGPSSGGWFTPDGRTVVFNSAAGDLGPPDSGRTDVYARDLVTGQVTLISANADGTDSGNERSFATGLTAGGRIVVFQSGADDLGPTDHRRSGTWSSDQDDIYTRDLTTGVTTLVSSNADGTDSANGASLFGAASANGATIALGTFGSDLGPPDHNGDRESDLYAARYRGEADLAVGLDAPGVVGSGDQLTYTLALTNAGPNDAEGVSAALLLPEGVSFVSADSTTGTCTGPTPAQPQLVSCGLGDGAVGDLAEIEVIVTVTAAPGTTLDAGAAVSSHTFDPRAGDNLLRHTTTVG